MDKQQHMYRAGAFLAYNTMSGVIERAIKNNGGATTALGIINVFNEITAHVHYQKQELKGAFEIKDEEATKEALLAEIKALNAALEQKLGNVYIFEGGKQL